MFKKIVVIMICGFFFGGCSLISRKAGVEIIAYPTAKVFINGKEAGMTPYKNSSLKPEETEIKLVANDLTWTRKIKLQNNVNTVIDWEFGKEEKESGGYVLYMEKTGDEERAGLLVNAVPNKSAIAVEEEMKGYSPAKIDDIGEGDKQVTISFPAYKTVIVFVKALKGYQLVIDTNLALEDSEKTEEISPTPTALEENKEKMIMILPTETGWLRVRETPSSSAKEVIKVKPGEKYKLLEEASGWSKIELGGGKNGWISSKYAEKL